MRRNFFLISKIVIASGLMLGLFLWLDSHYDWNELLTRWNSVDKTLIAICVALVCLSHFLRAYRIYYSYSANEKVRLLDVCAVSLSHNTLSSLLPMKLGELALPILSKHKLNIGLGKSAVTLLLIRLLDAHVLMVFVLFFAANIWLDSYGLILSIGFLLLTPAMVPIARRLTTLHPKLEPLGDIFANIKLLLMLYIQSILIWSVKLTAFALIALSLGNLAIDHAWLATIIADASALSPITGFANTGTYEVAFVAPLLPLGYSSDELVKIALNLHIFVFITNLLAGASGALLLLLPSKKLP
ncbi:MAG: uncharacterized membrane protein YbhN (UPF0104 family) [Flavobacteriales bacterium]|jgi:uncharacterized membrane protein YbhN (UPF0104 family)